MSQILQDVGADQHRERGKHDGPAVQQKRVDERGNEREPDAAEHAAKSSR